MKFYKIIIMKRTVISLFALLFLPALLLAQNPNRERIEAYRIAFFTQRLKLTPSEAEKFWPVYREFSLKRQELKQQYNTKLKNPDPTKTVEENEKEKQSDVRSPHSAHVDISFGQAEIIDRKEVNERWQ